MRQETTRRYTADFETVTWLEDETDVWLWATCEIGNETNTEWGIDIEGFIDWCKINDNIIVYFHNLKFDGEFIISYLLNNGYKCVNDKRSGQAKTFKTLISDMGLFFSIKIYFSKNRYVTIYDSLKVLPTSVEEMPKAFDIPLAKLDIDYQKPRPKGYVPSKQEIDYVLNDVKIPAMALNKLFEINLTKMTLASNALDEYKRTIGKRPFEHFYPVLDINIDADIRTAYRGGFTYLNAVYKDSEVGEGVVLDVNSLYPSVLYDCKLPMGTPKFFKGKYEHDDIYDLYIQHITCGFELKKGKIPTIQIKGDKRFRGNEYLTSSNGHIVDLRLTNIDLELFFENYEPQGLHYEDGWKFRSLRGLFKKYIDKWMTNKNDAKAAGNKALYTISKLMLNSLYGKFGLNPMVKSKTPYLKDGVVKYETDKKAKKKKGVYIPMAVFVTSYARNKTIRSSQKIKDYSISKYGQDMYIYSDTDSIHTTLPSEDSEKILDIDDYKLGAWKLENKFCRAKFIRQKTYIEDIWDDKHKEWCIKITCAGMPEACYDQVTFKNFCENLRVWGKLGYKHVVGGVKLVEGDFTIKENSFIANYGRKC